MVTINTADDLLRALAENPVWKEAVRQEILTEELMNLPARFDRFVATTEAFMEEQREVNATTAGFIAEQREVNATTAGFIAEQRQVNASTADFIAEQKEYNVRMERAGGSGSGRHRQSAGRLRPAECHQRGRRHRPGYGLPPVAYPDQL